MKKTLKIMKIALALTLALVVGIWFGTSINVLNKQADALDLTMDMNPSNQETNEPLTEPSLTMEQTEELPKGVVSANSELPTEDGKQPFSRSLVYELAISFEAPIYWAVADNGVLVDYDSIEELVLEHYADFANLDLARTFAYAFFYEENNQVHLLPQLPQLFQPDENFEMIQVAENEFKVKQANIGTDDSTIYIVFDFKYDEESNAWKIDNILYE